MPRSTQEIIDHADELADRFEAYDPDPADQRDPTPLESIRAAAAERTHAEVTLAEAIPSARKAGYSWAAIGALLGTSGEAARQRYGPLSDH